MYKIMFLSEKTHRYLKNDYQFFHTLNTKDHKISGTCNLLIKVKFHELEWSSPLILTYPFVAQLYIDMFKKHRQDSEHSKNAQFDIYAIIYMHIYQTEHFLDVHNPNRAI